MSDPAFPQYTWIVVCAFLCCMAYAYLIGANDVANAFASSVSSKSLTLKQAVIAAGIFEFLGAFLLGASVTGTIRGKIIDIDQYEDEPDVLMFGMFTALLTASMILYVATYFGLPVSTTHDMIACIMGFSIVAHGWDSVQWDVAKKLYLSWITSPLIAGAVAFIFFALVKYCVLTKEDSFHRAYYTFPIVLFIGFGVNTFYVVYKAGNNLAFLQDVSPAVCAGIAVGVGIFAGLVWVLGFGPCVLRRIEREREERAQAALEEAVGVKDPEAEKGTMHTVPEEVDEIKALRQSIRMLQQHTGLIEEEDIAKEQALEETAPVTNKVVAKTVEEPELEEPQGLMAKIAASTYKQDLEKQSREENHRAAAIWDAGEDYDHDAERLFNFIQVFTACLNSFGHGANDVANAIAPLSAVYYIFQTGTVESKTGVQKWLLAMGGAFIVIGLATFGYRVMKSLGYKLTKLSASRGSCAELGASLTVVTASFLAIPVSSTQCIVGAIAGVGLVNGPQNVQWFFLLRVMFSWGLMYLLAVMLSMAVFAFAVLSPDLA